MSLHEHDMNRLAKAGGTAFPHQVIQGDGTHEIWSGMTLRDYFAAAALQGLLAQSIGTAYGTDPKFGAEYAYAAADAMIKERSK